jgi:hypothetical protein
MKINDINFCLNNLKHIYENIPQSELSNKVLDSGYLTVGDCLENVIEKLQQEEVRELNKDKSYIL